MNFKFVVGDIVVLNGRNEEMVLVREYVDGVFHAKRPDGSVLRVRSAQLLRVRRPSDEARAVEVAERKARKKVELKVRQERIDRNRMEFAEMQEFRVRLTAKGLPDKRCKPKFSAKNAPDSIKPRGRSNLM